MSNQSKLWFDKSLINCRLLIHYRLMLTTEAHAKLRKITDWLTKHGIDCDFYQGQNYGDCWCLDVKDDTNLETAEELYKFIQSNILHVNFKYDPERGFTLTE